MHRSVWRDRRATPSRSTRRRTRRSSRHGRRKYGTEPDVFEGAQYQGVAICCKQASRRRRPSKRTSCERRWRPPQSTRSGPRRDARLRSPDRAGRPNREGRQGRRLQGTDTQIIADHSRVTKSPPPAADEPSRIESGSGSRVVCAPPLAGGGRGEGAMPATPGPLPTPPAFVLVSTLRPKPARGGQSGLRPLASFMNFLGFLITQCLNALPRQHSCSSSASA